MSLPKPSGRFEWTQESWGPVLRCSAMPAGAAHLFSTRQLVLDGSRHEPHRGWAQVAATLGVPSESLVRLRQVHGREVFVAEAPIVPSGEWPAADIAVTDASSVAISVRAADCVPILLADPASRAVAAVHAGWRGTAAGAATTAVEALSTRFGARPEHLIAAVGPSIGPCCYLVREDLIARFGEHPEATRWFRDDDGLRLNLWLATQDQLVRAGLPPENIHVCELCTSHHPAVFHSYRRDGAAASRLVAAIRTLPGTTP